MNDNIRIRVYWPCMRCELSRKPIVPACKAEILWIRRIVNKILIVNFITRKPAITLSI